MLFLQLSFEYVMHTASCICPKNKIFTRILAKHWQFDSKHFNPSEKGDSAFLSLLNWRDFTYMEILYRNTQKILINQSLKFSMQQRGVLL